MYYSNEDFENFYVRYKAEGLPRNITVKDFCIRNNVPWNLFDKWYRDTRHRIKEVAVTGRPEVKATEAQPGTPCGSATEESRSESASKEPGLTRIMADIRMSNGLHIFQKNLSYRKFLALVENLEALC